MKHCSIICCICQAGLKSEQPSLQRAPRAGGAVLRLSRDFTHDFILPPEISWRFGGHVRTTSSFEIIWKSQLKSFFLNLSRHVLNRTFGNRTQSKSIRPDVPYTIKMFLDVYIFFKFASCSTPPNV